ncbi:MAG: hypothetical protein GWN18_16640, partial [Thermoplasmata archaeon]|nr:hypothetical protein [Thermoplasmata archaeon]NIS13707.1 hypothetical protein [Thermoplasmata archaeon]NIS21577.1 hypothetical protein [Thermoplasmata archaeon]NIT79151.1 hypothetical protein [Thermoplasmata archaeon]NIU50616.1 hypothetical protein [Thermoplasmata archaeon]
AYTGDTFTFRVLVEDNAGLSGASVTWTIGDDEEVLVMEREGTPNRATFSIDVVVPSDSLGPLKYSFKVEDMAGNTMTSSEVSVDVFDNDPPTLVEDLTPG